MSVETINNLSDINNWYELTPDRSEYLLLDPTNGSHLAFNAIPQWLEEDPTFGVGLEFLRSRGKSIVIGMMASPHGYETDLGDLDLGRYEKAVQKSDYYGFEAYANTPDLMQQFQTIARTALMHTVEPETDFSAYLAEYRAEVARKTEGAAFSSMPHFDRFVARVARAIALYTTEETSFSYDIQQLSGVAVEETIVGKCQELIYSTDEVTEEKMIAFTALTNAREFIMAARLGLALREQEVQQPQRDIDVSLTVGLAHPGLAHKIRRFGSYVVFHEMSAANYAPNNEALFLGRFSRGDINLRKMELGAIRRVFAGNPTIPGPRSSLDQLKQEAAGLVR